MEQKPLSERKPDPARLEAMKRLPKDLMLTLTREEIDAFLFEEEWPESLRVKLKDYLV